MLLLSTFTGVVLSIVSLASLLLLLLSSFCRGNHHSLSLYAYLDTFSISLFTIIRYQVST